MSKPHRSPALRVLAALGLTACAPNLTPVPDLEPDDGGSGGSSGSSGDVAGSEDAGETAAGDGDGDDADAWSGDPGDGDGDGDGSTGDGDGDGGTGDGDGDGDGDGFVCQEWEPGTACIGGDCSTVEIDWTRCASVWEYRSAVDGSALVRDGNDEAMTRIDPGGSVTPLPYVGGTWWNGIISLDGDAYVDAVDLNLPSARLDRYDSHGVLLASTPAWFGQVDQICQMIVTHEPGTVVVQRGQFGFEGCWVNAMHLMRGDGSEAVSFVPLGEASLHEFRSSRVGLYRLDPFTDELSLLDLTGSDWWVAPVWTGSFGRVAAAAEAVDHVINDQNPRLEIVGGLALPLTVERTSTDVAIDPTGTWWADEERVFDGLQWTSSVRLFTNNALVRHHPLPSGSSVRSLDVNERGELLVSSLLDDVSTLEFVAAVGTVQWSDLGPSAPRWTATFQEGGDAFVLVDASDGLMARMLVNR